MYVFMKISNNKTLNVEEIACEDSCIWKTYKTGEMHMKMHIHSHSETATIYGPNLQAAGAEAERFTLTSLTKY